MKSYRVYYSYDIESVSSKSEYPIIRFKRDTFDIEFESKVDTKMIIDKIGRIAESDCKPNESVKYANYYKIEEFT